MDCHEKLCKPVKKYITEIEEDENGEPVITFPKELTDDLNWKEGDEILFKNNDDGTFTLLKLKRNDREVA